MNCFNCFHRFSHFAIGALLLFAATLPAADRFPGAHWDVAPSPSAAGWSAERLQEAKAYAETIATAAVVIVHRGLIVEQWGETERPFNCHSMRKSFLSALYGIHVAAGTIRLDRTLAQLGIDDNEPSLTPTELNATVHDLIKARSGIYHPALYETAGMKARRPERGSHAPGTFWYYNNWDFNALGSIFENLTGRSLFEEFENRIARPLGLEDFDRQQHTSYVTGRDSVHPAYPFRLSARDLARFGLLFVRGGRWNDAQIVPESWVVESTASYSDAGNSGGYGYMWWVAREGRHYPGVELPEGAFTARGAGGHVLLIVPQWDLVIAHRVDTFRRNHQVSSEEFGQLLNLMLAAMPDAAKTEVRLAVGPPLPSPLLPPRKERETANPKASPVIADREPPFDLLLKNGRIMDGTGNPWYHGDVAIRAGRIAAVGRLNSASAARTIDVSGQVIAPGFIDLHSHADRGLTSPSPDRRAAPNLVSQGITTVVVNQDGFGAATLDQQLASLQQLGIGPHVVLMIGHGGIRHAVMGNDHQRAATEVEIAQMQQLLRDALQLGAFGMSSGLEYVPGRWSTTGEIKALAAEVAKFDAVYIAHERSSGATPMWYLPSRDESNPLTMIDNITELIEIGETTGARVVATHIKARGEDFWGSSARMIELINAARQRGVRIYADQYPYNTSGSDGSIVLLPDWLPARVAAAQKKAEPESAPPDGNEEQLKPTPADLLEAALRDEGLAAALRRDLEHEIIRRGGAGQILIMDYPDAELIGKSLYEVARERALSPLELVIRLQLEGHRARSGGVRLRSFSMSETDLEAFARQPWTATSSDAGIALPSDRAPVHPRFYGSFPRKIRHYALERGVLSVEDAVRSATSLPAQILGLRDRGQVREGFHADLVVFDLERIRDRATAMDPHRYSEGIEHVLAGGTFVVEGGQLTARLPGRVILRPPSSHERAP